MAEPIRKPRESYAPTPQNTPASVSSVPPPSARETNPMASIQEQGAGPLAGLGGLASNPALLSMIQGRLGTLVGKSSGYIESLPQAVRDRLAGLKGVRLANAEIEAEFQRELYELEKKFHAKQSPLYERRHKIITGEIEPTDAEIEAGRAAFEEEREMFGDDDEEDDEDDEEDEDEDDEESTQNKISEVKEDDEEEEDEATASANANVSGVPSFWLTALKNLPQINNVITERDDEILASLTDIRLKYLDRPGFALEFEFADNAAFTNKVLTKTHYYQEEVGITGEFVYDHAEGTDIKWTSPESNVTIRIEKRKQRNKHTKATRTIEKVIADDSFFHFFSPPQPPADDEEEDEYDEEQQKYLEIDFEFGELIKEKLIPHAIDWFTGKALDYEGLGAEDEDDEEFDEDFDDEDEDDEDEDDEDGEESGSKKEAPPECKQQ